MKSLLRYTIQPLYRLWLRWAYDDHKIRLTKRRRCALGWTLRGFTIDFRRQDYAVILKACRIRKQSTIRFFEEAAVERARFILQTENPGGINENRVN